MKNFFLLIAFCLYGLIVFSQKGDSEKVFVKVEIETGPNKKEWDSYIGNNTRLPDSVQEKIPNGIYKAIVEFIVDIHGNLGQVKLKTDPGYGLGEKAIHIIQGYKGEWKPASQCGRLVRSYKQQLIIFKIDKGPGVLIKYYCKEDSFEIVTKVGE